MLSGEVHHLLSYRQSEGSTTGGFAGYVTSVRLRIVCAVVLLLFLVACGGSPGSPPAPVSPPTFGSPPAPGSPPGPGSPYDPGSPDYYPREEVPGLADYIEACRRLNRDLEEANVVYKDTESMRRADAHIIEAAATLRTKVPPQEILESEGAVGSRVRVSCKVEAELRGAESDFDIQQSGWQRRSLLTSPTARWTWSVTPKRGGDHELVLAVRPVISLEDEMSKALPPQDLEASAQIYRIMVDVSVPADQWLAEAFDRLTSLLTSARGMILAISVLAVAIYGLRATVRRKRVKSSPTGDATPS